MRSFRRAWNAYCSLPEIMRFGILLLVLFLVLIVLPTGARADVVYEAHGGDRILVTNKPCPPEISTQAPQGQRGYYLAAEATIAGKVYRACGTLVTIPGRRGPQVHLIYEDGDQGILPLADFKPVSGV